MINKHICIRIFCVPAAINLGFYFIIFQSQFNGFVKCFIDGSESATFYSNADFLDLVKQVQDSSLISNVREALSTASFYLWDVSNSTVKRLRAFSSASSLVEEMLKIKPQITPSSSLIEQITV